MLVLLLVAHISLERSDTHLSRYGDGEQKTAPCGRKDGLRGTNIYGYRPGETITIRLTEFVTHPGYFRIAFDADGDDGFLDPVSIKPIDPARKCPNGPGDHCGESDFYNNEAVLMDNLDPHLAGKGAPEWEWQVTLPNIECDNCTLQVIQVMEDDLFHGPYDVTPGVGVADVYHQCIDLVLSNGALPPVPTAKEPSGGCASATPSLTILLLAALHRRSRTRRR